MKAGRKTPKEKKRTEKERGKSRRTRRRNEPRDLYINLYVRDRAKHLKARAQDQHTNGQWPVIVFGCSAPSCIFLLLLPRCYPFLLLLFLPFSFHRWNISLAGNRGPCLSLYVCARIVSHDSDSLIDHLGYACTTRARPRIHSGPDRVFLLLVCLCDSVTELVYRHFRLQKRKKKTNKQINIFDRADVGTAVS